MQVQALSATVAWLRLERAYAEYGNALRKVFGVTPLQLSILTILAERPALPLAALRKALVMHAATLGQAVDEMRRLELVIVRSKPQDRRARVVAITGKGLEVLEMAPKAGPVRLRTQMTDPARLDALTSALTDAVDLFGLAPWLPEAGDGR
jgi:DNA-binding MarR family transcriptional regulator